MAIAVSYFPVYEWTTTFLLCWLSLSSTTVETWTVWTVEQLLIESLLESPLKTVSTTPRQLHVVHSRQAGRQMEIGNWQLAQVKTKLWQLASTSLCSISLFSRCWNIAYGGAPPGGRLLRPLPRLFFTCSPHFFLQNVFLIYPLAEEKTWVRNFISSTQNRLVYLGEVEVERFDYAKENRSTAHTHIVMQV